MVCTDCGLVISKIYVSEYNYQDDQDLTTLQHHVMQKNYLEPIKSSPIGKKLKIYDKIAIQNYHVANYLIELQQIFNLSKQDLNKIQYLIMKQAKKEKKRKGGKKKSVDLKLIVNAATCIVLRHKNRVSSSKQYYKRITKTLKHVAFNLTTFRKKIQDLGLLLKNKKLYNREFEYFMQISMQLDIQGEEFISECLELLEKIKSYHFHGFKASSLASVIAFHLLRKENKKLKQRKFTRQDVSDITKTSPKTITEITRILKDEGILIT